MDLHLRIDGTTFRDSKNRQVTLHGINVAGDAKFPLNPDQPSHEPKGFLDGEHVSFVGRPFPLKDAPLHFARLRRWGYNVIRYIFTWEAIEAAGPGRYDEDFIQYTIEVLRVAKQHGFHVFMDPHQDVWSRFTGGSGAPLWTLYACGLNPEKFLATEASLVQNLWPEPKTFPKMIWATNYTRLACQVLFTIFFAGREFAPKAIIDGVNIQDYLQGHFIAACKHLAQRIKEAGDLDGSCVIGWESVNEPNRGLIGLQDISTVPSEQKLQLGTSPTAWQAMLTGSGRACEIETWQFGGMGPYRSGSQLVDPHGQSAWLPATFDDSKYGFKRDPGWKLGECLWAQHGVWDSGNDTLLRSDYFGINPKTGETIDYEYFTNKFFMRYYRRYRDNIRSVFPDTIMFCQPPVLEIPPSIKNTSDDDPNMVFAPHWYDGVTLMTKKWNRLWNVDVFGVLRHKYLAPAFAVKIGETAIRNCFRDQLSAIRKEGLDYMGIHPHVFTELGIPYDMDDGYAYKTGKYTSQVAAMDANHFALEGSNSNFTLWNYTPTNVHEWGDQWNGEDLSIFSKDDLLLPDAANTSSSSYVDSAVSSLQRTMSTDSIRARGASGYRAAEAYVRPTPVATHGDVVAFGFDLKNCVFELTLHAPSSTASDAPTEVFLPEFHFPRQETTVAVSGGKWDIVNEEIGDGSIQRLKWWHQAGDQRLRVTGPKRKVGLAIGQDEETYLDHCREKACHVM